MNLGTGFTSLGSGFNLPPKQKRTRVVHVPETTTCNGCAGTGDRYDFLKDDWYTPIMDCFRCNGTGQVRMNP